MYCQAWVDQRGSPTSTRLCLAVLVALFLFVPSVVGCGSTEPGGGAEEVLTIEQALAAEPGETIKVSGAIVATGSGTDADIVLTSVLLESYPPQAGGAILPVTGLDLESLVGLNSTIDQPDLSPGHLVRLLGGARGCHGERGPGGAGCAPYGRDHLRRRAPALQSCIRAPH